MIYPLLCRVRREKPAPILIFSLALRDRASLAQDLSSAVPDQASRRGGGRFLFALQAAATRLECFQGHFYELRAQKVAHGFSILDTLS